MSKNDIQTIIEALLRSRESLQDYERYHDLKMTSQEKETILSQIGFCTACRHWYRIYEMAGFDVCLNCMHHLR